MLLSENLYPLASSLPPFQSQQFKTPFHLTSSLFISLFFPFLPLQLVFKKRSHFPISLIVLQEGCDFGGSCRCLIILCLILAQQFGGSSHVLRLIAKWGAVRGRWQQMGRKLRLFSPAAEDGASRLGENVPPTLLWLSCFTLHLLTLNAISFCFHHTEDFVPSANLPISLLLQ